MSLVDTNDNADFVLMPTPGNTHLPLMDDVGRTIGHVELRVCLAELPAGHPELEHLHQEVLQLRNVVSRLQAQLKMLEQKVGRR
jgi:hypothetical protein